MLNLSSCEAIEVLCAKEKVKLITFDNESFGRRIVEKFLK